ncbi:hypothetical protein TWF696_007939 [Orbilia brochopaga]|uniref:Uncharacterized protein n=1 Tax=Orbilia brochopaga TaxID=3140254 RepID=A0AAV9UME8_9PEZI
MTVLQSIVSTLQPRANTEVNRSTSIKSKNGRRINITKKDISGPSNFMRLSSPDWRTAVPDQGLRPLTLSNVYVDFNKKLPSPPTFASEAESEVQIRESMGRKILRFGISLDLWVRFIIVLSFCEAIMAGWGGMQIILSGKLSYGRIWTVMTAILLVWCVCFVGAAYCGFSILWGRWSSSPTALRVMRLVATLLTILYGTASALWFFYGFQSATSTRTMCVTTLIFWDGQTIPAPKPWVDLCLQTASNFETLQVAWGFMNAFQVYFMMLLVLWASDQERKLRQQRRWSRNSGLAYTETEGDRDRSFEKMSEVEMSAQHPENLPRSAPKRNERRVTIRQEDDPEKQARATEDGMEIPNFPMPSRNNNRVRLPIVHTPSSIPETVEDGLRTSAREDDLLRGSALSALSGAIPIALDLRNLNSPRFYGRAF